MINIVRADRIQGMMPSSCLHFFASEAAKCKAVAEVGCWRGRTTRALCDNTSANVFAVDTWLGSPELMQECGFMAQQTGDGDWLFHEFLHNVADCANLKIIRLPSVEAAAYFRSIGQTFDMVILDAAHDFESVKADILAWYPLIREGGYLLGDDYFHDDVKRAVESVFGKVDQGPLEGSRLWGAPAPIKEAA